MPALENPNWERFCQAFVYGEAAGNARRSYMLVYGTENPDSAGAAAARLRQSEPVAGRIEELLAEAQTDELERRRRAEQALALTRESVLANLKSIAQVNVLDYVTIGEDGNSVINFAALHRDRAAAVEHVMIDLVDGEKPRVRFKLGGRHRALTDIGHHIGLRRHGEVVAPADEVVDRNQIVARIGGILDQLDHYGVDIDAIRRSRRNASLLAPQSENSSENTNKS